MRVQLFIVAGLTLFASCGSAQTDEIVANLAGGRVIVNVARDAIVFGVINHPIETTSVPPRAAQVDPSHIGIFFVASEWQVPAQKRSCASRISASLWPLCLMLFSFLSPMVQSSHRVETLYSTGKPFCFVNRAEARSDAANE